MWAALFPGQGSQSIGMGKVLCDNFKSVQVLFEQASDTLHLDFKKLCFEGPESELILTHNTQPSLLLVSVATNQVLIENLNLPIKIALGHSVGEYSALVSAGVIDFISALKAVRIRGESMQSAVPVGQGGMAAVIGLSEDQVIKLCQWVEIESGFKPLSAANFNAPGQIVISGSQNALKWLKENNPESLFSDSKPKIRIIPLQVSAPFHCKLMKTAQEKMEIILNNIEFKNAKFPIIQNYTAKPESDAEILRKNLIEQISAPVLWQQSVLCLKNLGFEHCIELGAGKVLSGLIKKIDGQFFKAFNIQSLEDLKLLESVKF